MIVAINYTVDGKTYSLVKKGDNTWSREANAPNVVGNYALTFKIIENFDGNLRETNIDSSDSRYATCLQVIESIQEKIKLIEYLPDFLQNITEFKVLFDAEGNEFDKLASNKERVINDMFLTTASNDAITRVENFVGIKGLGTLEQRKIYLISLFQKGKKLNEKKFNEITKTISGSNCIVTFFTSEDSNNPEPGNGLIKVQVLSPDYSRDYRYKDIERALKPLIPAHIKLLVIRYFATWTDIYKNFTDWAAINTSTNWKSIKDFIPPQ